MKIRNKFLSIALLLSTLLCLSSSFSSSTKMQNKCVYTIYARTGSIVKAGTDSRVSLVLGDSSGNSVWIPNLKHWGLMGQDHDYFERANLDIFTGRGRCMGRPVCRVNVTSDGSGTRPGWYLNYVEVTSTGPHIPCSQSLFHVEQWLALDVPPYKLTAQIDRCEPKKPISEARRFLVK
ncbi:PLAT domain-containing protein 3-like [Andrographis paniculata]|uniref:PLAT domain-containing protein 3-like n=1 Tax=Andrographis paniculata TaxID=175694 RepID=UPI0021E8A7D1|nr:PLAT domain-containing protein 3-like [Andrographis paniculata]XP_051143533.1 PLAT domain-containing protein 3-like [Andrographis paniculata]